MTQNYTFSDINTAQNVATIPPKTRTVRKSPLFARLEKLKIGDAFIIDNAQMASVAANVYATAKRAGIKVSLRQLPEGVGVWRVRNTNSNATQSEDGQTQAQSNRRVYKSAQGRSGRKAA